MQTLQCVRFALSGFRVAINNAFMAILCRWQQCKLYLGVHVKCPIFLSDFTQIWIFSTDFRKSLRY